MSKINTSKKFVSINIGVVTISDTRTLKNDKSGDFLKERIKNFGHNITKRIIIKDDGKGIDPNVIKSVALKKKELHYLNLEMMTDKEITNLFLNQVFLQKKILLRFLGVVLE